MLTKKEPSLATWYYIIQIFYPHREKSRNNVLQQVIERIEKVSASDTGLEVKDEDDSLFFKIAMEKATLSEQNIELAKRIQKLTLQKDNIKFLNDMTSYNRFR